MEIGLTDEDLPNERSDDVDSTISGISDGTERQHVVTVAQMPQNVLVTTTANLISDSETLRATRIIIHDPSTLSALNGTPVTFNPLNRSLSVPEKNFSWDSSVYDNVLPVRCRNVKGELHKNRFGSGNRGRSIIVNGQWRTPSEFEALCGRGNSKDWKRSIRYAGRSLMCLINEGILRPHATSCTCGNCCDDSAPESECTPVSATGPVRLFTPYKRRKRQLNTKLKVSTNVPNVEISSAENVASAPIELSGGEELSTNGNSTDSVVNLTVPFVTVDANTSVIPESVIVTPASTPQTPRCAPTAIDFSEQKQWWQLEEMVKNAVRQITELQKQVEIVKNQSAAAREAALKQLRIQMENEKREAVSACRIEAQVAVSQTILQAKSEKEAAVEKALHQFHLINQEKVSSIIMGKAKTQKKCANCDREAFSECTGCHKIYYCSPFCQQKDWKQHQEECSHGILNTEDDCSSLVNDCSNDTNS